MHLAQLEVWKVTKNKNYQEEQQYNMNSGKFQTKHILPTTNTNNSEVNNSEQ